LGSVAPGVRVRVASARFRLRPAPVRGAHRAWLVAGSAWPHRRSVPPGHAGGLRWCRMPAPGGPLQLRGRPRLDPPVVHGTGRGPVIPWVVAGTVVVGLSFYRPD